MPFCLSISNTPLYTMALTFQPATRHPTHLPLPNVHTSQCSLCKTLLQPAPHTTHQHHQHGHTYIGSTSITIPKREYNRHAKLKQLHNNHPISAELSLRYWHSKNNLHHYSTIYLSHHDTYDQAWTYEHLRIQEWQPTLNWPYIQRHLKLKASGWQFAKHRTTFTRMSTHKRLFQRLRRRQNTIKQPHLHTSQRLHALTVLRELSKHTHSSFETSTAIRSGKYTDLEIYAFRRVSASLEEPDRSRVLHLIHSALSFRNLTPPKANKPFTIPFLSHSTFFSSTEKWLRTLIQHHMHHVIPFHPPTTKLREAARKTLRSRLYNHKRWEELFSAQPSAADMPCSCHHMHSLLRPNHTPPLYDGHYVLTLDDLQLPSHLQIFLQANMNSTFFPTKTIFSTLPTTTHSMATTPWSTYRPSPTQPTFSTPTMETTHCPHPTHTTIHITQCHPITAVPHGQAGVTSRRPRTTKSTAFLPTTLFPRMSHYLEHTTTFSTTTRPHCPTTPPTAHSIFPRQHTTSLPMGIPQTILHTTWSSLPQTKEVMAKRKNSHQLFQIYSWHTVASHLQGLGHYASSSSTSTSRPTFHPQPMATPPQPLPDNT